MDEEEGSYDAIKRHNFNPSIPLESTTRPSPNTKWLTREKFGMNIGNASRFKAWMPLGKREESELSYEQKVCSKVSVLTQMILHGKQSYIATCGDFGYDQSDSE